MRGGWTKEEFPPATVMVAQQAVPPFLAEGSTSAGDVVVTLYVASGDKRVSQARYRQI